jgi:hypothetical protein
MDDLKRPIWEKIRNEKLFGCFKIKYHVYVQVMSGLVSDPSRHAYSLVEIDTRVR